MVTKRNGGSWAILAPAATVFISSFCIMALELVAGRLIARHLGSSLYTWTSVIGVILGGITIGYYAGGRIADRFTAKKTLSAIFILSSASCVLTIILNNIVGDWIWLWYLSWPVRTFSHVSLVFLLPSILLGTISPVVAKMALDKGLPQGRTVGDIYAWGAAGSIAGTFAAGFYLIAAMGTVAIIWTIGAVLLLIGTLYRPRFWFAYVWAVVFAAALTMGIAPLDWAKDKSTAIGLREKPDPRVLYEDESQYCYISVRRVSETTDQRAFMQDKLMHSEIIMGDINDLQYAYSQIYAHITRLMSKNKDKLKIMVIGGGGYVWPRYVETNWPGSFVEVVEIDPRVTEAAVQGFGLERNTSINTINMDARYYIDELLRQNNSVEMKKYDFIYEDALNDYSVPYQLCTKEFNDKISQLLTDDGAYMIELIDIYDSGMFVGAFVNTLEQTFPYVYVATDDQPRTMRNTLVVIATKKELNREEITFGRPLGDMNLWLLNDLEVESLRKKSKRIVLTDDFAPVENLLAPVVRRSSKGFLADRYIVDAKELKKEGKWEEAIARYQKAVQVEPAASIMAYNDMALILAEQGKLEEAVETFRKALAYNEQYELGSHKARANIHQSLNTALQRLGREQEANAEFELALEEYHKQLTKTPGDVKTFTNIGNLLAGNGKFAEAAGYFEQAVNLDPTDLSSHFNLIQALEFAGQFDRAIEVCRKSNEFFAQYDRKQEATQLQQYLEQLEFKKSKHQK